MEKKDSQVYNYITQPLAATYSRGMYVNDKFESDLINSYAWDTTILFLQTFDNRISPTLIYSRQTDLSGGVCNTGTDTDIVCNVYDMASNCREWTTETSNSSERPYVMRGGSYWRDDFMVSDPACKRLRSPKLYAGASFSFRPIIYIK